jgi:beta-lactamase regulating signal transducer with metallopeptidase domain
MNTMELLTGPLAQAIGWALLHLLWQATIVAVILAAVLALMAKQTANARYVTACGALAIVFAMFVATAIRAYDPAAAPIVIDDPVAATETIRVSLSQIPVLLAESAAQGLKERVLLAAASARTKLPLIVAIWLAGVVLLSSRLLVSWIRARQLVRRGAQPATHEWQRVATRLSSALGLRRGVQLLESAAVEVPSVIGTLRPVILIPASTLSGLTPEHIEMVLAHELAHIRRHDFFVNLLQALVETLMFYHPAVWWMSRRVRIERENCCDDLAVAVCGNPIQYARALTRLEELRAASLPTVVAANGGSLLDRIRRIAAGRAERTSSSSRWAAAVAMLAIIMLAVAIPSLPALAERKAKRAPKVTEPAAARAEVDAVVVEPVIEENDLASPVVEPDGDAASDADADAPDADTDHDYDYDFDDEALLVVTPAPPAPPAWPAVAAIAPVAPTPAPSVYPVPAVAPTPRTPRPPQYAAFLSDRDRDEDDEGESDRALGDGGRLTVDELVSLRAHGVTPEYVNEMRSLFPGLSLRGVTGMKAVGVSVDFVKQMRATGFAVKTAREATSLAAVGVTPEFISNMRAAGLAVTSAREATSLAAVGVSAEYIKAMRDAGFEVSSAREASGLRAVGVTPEWLRELRAAGVEVQSARDAQSLRALGVTAEFVKRLANAGYANLSIRELTRLAAAGVDEDFIREMEQYRKKN